MFLCSSGLDSPCIFKAEELNEHFSGVSFDPSASSLSEYLENLNLPVLDYLSRFSFTETCLGDVWSAFTYTSSQARGTDDILQSVVKASFPVIGL